MNQSPASAPRRWPDERRAAAAVIAAAGLALLAAACGGSPGGHVAQLGSTATQPAASSGSAKTGGAANSHSPTSGPLAFSHCMRSNGVTNFPDPNSSGVLPKLQIARLAAGDPQFVPAHRACEHLLPNGGQPTPSQVQQAWNDMRSFAGCMRSHGVQSWPEPTVTSRQDNRPFFNVPVSTDPNSPQITTKINACQHVLHTNNPLVTTQ